MKLVVNQDAIHHVNAKGFNYPLLDFLQAENIEKSLEITTVKFRY